MTSQDGALAVIIGRAGSKGLPGKNSRLLAGRPIVQYSIEDALETHTVSRVILSTDGEEIARAGRAMGVEVVHRPPALAHDTAMVDAAVRQAVESCRCAASIVVILYANVPVRPHGLIDRAVTMLVETGADSVQSYTPVGKHHPYWMVRLDQESRISPYVENAVYRRQDLPRLMVPDGGVIAVTHSSLFTVVEGQPHAFLGIDRRGIETPVGSVVDIDDEIDLRVAEAMLEAAALEAPR